MSCILASFWRVKLVANEMEVGDEPYEIESSWHIVERWSGERDWEEGLKLKESRWKDPVEQIENKIEELHDGVEISRKNRGEIDESSWLKQLMKFKLNETLIERLITKGSNWKVQELWIELKHINILYNFLPLSFRYAQQETFWSMEN